MGNNKPIDQEVNKQEVPHEEPAIDVTQHISHQKEPDNEASPTSTDPTPEEASTEKEQSNNQSTSTNQPIVEQSLLAESDVTNTILGKFTVASANHEHQEVSAAEPHVATLPLKHKPELPLAQRLKRRQVWIPLVIILTLACVLAASLWYFSSHTLPNTYIGTQNVSFKSKQQVENIVANNAAAMNIQLESSGTQSNITLAELGVTYDIPSTVTSTFDKQSKITNKLQLWQKRATAYQYTLDQTKTLAYFENIKKATDQASQNASIVIENGVVSIHPEVIAKVSGVKDPERTIRTALDKAEPGLLTLEIYEETPKIRAADLEKSKSQIEQIINVPTSLVVNGNVVTATKEHIGSWIALTPNEAEKNVVITLDPIKVQSYVESAVKPYIKPPRSKVIIKNPDGTERELAPGEDGVDVVDKAGIAKEIITKINESKAVRVDVPVAFATRQTIYAGDYEKWLEVDLTSKRMYAYERGNLVNTFLVTAGAPETPTVTGEFKIQTKVRTQTMRGLNTDGSSYNVPNVEWVNYFYQDYAIHGNYWRPNSVFGNTNTSHGCVSLKNDGAQWVYDWAPVGTPVITHY